MKKLIYCALALAAGLFAASCQQENLEPVQGGNTVTFTVEIPEVATKAFNDGREVINDLVYAVYITKKETDKEAFADYANYQPVYQVNPTDVTSFIDGKTTVELELINDQNYVILFWAQSFGKGIYNTADLRNVSYAKVVTTDYAANQGDYAAFSGAAFIKKVKGASTEGVTLTRPFAQINIATADPKNYNVQVNSTAVTVKGAGAGFNVANQEAISGGDSYQVVFAAEGMPADETLKVNNNTYYSNVVNEEGKEDKHHYIAMNYVFAAGDVDVDYTINTDHGTVTGTVPSAPVATNYRTNITGDLLTSDVKYEVTLDKNWEAEYNVSPEGDVVKNTYVESASEILEIIETLNNPAENVQSAIITLNGDISLNDLFTTRSEASEDPSVTITNGNSLILDLNGKKLSATSLQTGKNYNMFDVRGNLTVKNGTIEYQHNGDNMGWNASTNIFNVTAGGVLNLDGVTAKNLGGSDMGFVAHLNNWGEVTLNAENCTLESNYVPVRVFNSGYDMNNVTIKNSTLKGGSAAFWVHNYTVEDFGTEEKAESQKALLNFSIYNQENTFSPDINGIRYGFTNSVRTDAYGITKTVSEDGTEVTLGTLVENGLVRRGVAGAEENTTITKAIVGEGITTLYDRTFRRFYALETVVLPSTLTTIGEAGSGVFQSCTALKNIVIPESVTVLGKGTFLECSSLESINIPAGVTRIEENALRATGLVSVEFHEGVTYFGAQAFRDCKQLKKVVINAPEFTIESNCFGSMAAPYPAVTIEVANAEMKAYLESTLTYANQFKVVSANVVANNAVEFIDAVNNVIEGGTITIGADFDFTDEEGGRTNNGSWWDGLGYSGDKSFTIDLNGKTIGDANGALNDYLFWFQNNGEKANTITIKNGTLDAGTTAFCALCTASSNKQTLTINVENVNLINEKNDGSTVKVRGGSIVNIKAGTKITGKDSYLGIENWKATVNIYDGAEIYMNGTASYNGCLVGVGGNGVINVYGGYGKGVSGGLIAMTSGGTINVAGGEWIANADGTYANSNKSVLIAQSDKQYNAGAGNAVVNVTGGTFKGGYNCYGNAVGDAQINIAGGNFNNNPTSYIVDGKTATEANGIWTVQ